MKVLLAATAAVTLLNAFPSQAAAQATDAQGRPSAITNPRWVVAPSPNFPGVARRNGIEQGRVELSCRPAQDGSLQDCQVISETPTANGFGEAALAATSQARVQPQSFYGPDSRVNFAVAFRPAEQAAGTLPNTFDRPATAAPVPAPAPQAAPAASSDPAHVAAAETALKATIAAMQAGTPNYDAMTPDLAAKVREQAATVTPLIQGFGALNGLQHVGNQNGAELFLVMFANAPTQWIINLTPEGKINALLFRPAPAAPTT